VFLLYKNIYLICFFFFFLSKTAQKNDKNLNHLRSIVLDGERHISREECVAASIRAFGCSIFNPARAPGVEQGKLEPKLIVMRIFHDIH